MSTHKLRVGVIGAGRMGERHCRVYSTMGEVEFAGLSDAAQSRGAATAARYGVPFHSDYRSLLDTVDAVSIATPTPSHFSIASECLELGIHTLVEKPLAGTIEEARELVKVAGRSGAVLQVGHIERFNPAYLELQSIVEGLDVVALNARRLSPFDTSNIDVDVVLDLMIHDADLALALAGKEVGVLHAQGLSARTGITDYAVASVGFVGGPMATLTASRITEQKVRLLEVTALGAYVEADLLNKNVSIYRRTVPEYLTNHHRPLRYRQENLVERIYIPTAEPLMLELQDFVRCAREGAAPRVSGEAGLRALELAMRIREQVLASQIMPALAAS